MAMPPTFFNVTGTSLTERASRENFARGKLVLYI